MKEIYRFISSKHFLHGWVFIYTSFLLFNICSSLYHQDYLHSSCFADFFINYQGGFVRRGLLGELLLCCYRQGLNPYFIAIGLSLGCYAIIAWYLIRHFLKRKYEVSILLMTFLLGGLGANGIEFYRRDFMILSVCILIIQLWRKMNLYSWIIISNIIVSLTILCYEPFIFIGVPVTILLTRAKKLDWKKSIFSWIPAIIPFGTSCLYPGGKDKYDAIVTSTSSFLQNPGVMSFLLDNPKDVMGFHLQINFVSGSASTPSIIVSFVMLFCMTFYFINATAVYDNNQHTWKQRRYILLIFSYMMLCLTPMFSILSIDCARTFMYATICTYMIYFAQNDQQLNQIFPKKLYQKADIILSISDKYTNPSPTKMLLIMLFIGLSQCTGMGFIECFKSAQLGTVCRIIYHTLNESLCLL